MLEEASKLYSSINVKDSIANHEFSLANILNIVLEKGKEEIDNHIQEQKKDTQQAIKETGENREEEQSILSTTTTKYECPDCGTTFDTPAGHRKHFQAFHGRIEEPKVIEQAEI